MPPRPPPSPSALTVLCSFAALLAVWLGQAVEQAARGLSGTLAGVPFHGLIVSPERHYLVTALQGSTASASAWGWLGMLLSGPLAVLLLALALHAMVSVTRAPGWLRGFSLVWLVVALLWLPLALALSALPGGAGPVAELYAALGDPRSGRWTAAALGVLLLLVAGGSMSARAVAVGRSWMRADGVEFRRRLVRVTAGWPGVTAVVVLAFGVGWAPTAWIIVMCITFMGVLRIRTV